MSTAGKTPRGRRKRPERASSGGRKALAIIIPILALLVIVIGLWATWGGDGGGDRFGCAVMDGGVVVV